MEVPKPTKPNISFKVVKSAAAKDKGFKVGQEWKFSADQAMKVAGGILWGRKSKSKTPDVLFQEETVSREHLRVQVISGTWII